mgnify:CR=1 FL=1
MACSNESGAAISSESDESSLLEDSFLNELLEFIWSNIRIGSSLKESQMQNFREKIY